MVIDVGKTAQGIAESGGRDGCFDTRAVYTASLKSANETSEQANLTSV